MLKAVLFQTIFAWALASIVYQIGSRIQNGTFNLANILIVSVIAVVVLVIILRSKKDKCTACPYCKSCNDKK